MSHSWLIGFFNVIKFKMPERVLGPLIYANKRIEQFFFIKRAKSVYFQFYEIFKDYDFYYLKCPPRL